MKPTTLLFSTNGRIGPRTFWRGVIILVAAQLIMNIIGLLVPSGSAIETVFSLAALVYMVALIVGYIGVYAKRLHDSGRTAAWFVLALVGFFILSVIFSYGLLRLVAPEVFTAMTQLLEAYETGKVQIVEVRLDELEAAMKARQGIIFLSGIISTFAVNVIIGWFVARLPSDRGTNRFGPPEGGDTHAFD